MVFFGGGHTPGNCNDGPSEQVVYVCVLRICVCVCLFMCG